MTPARVNIALQSALEDAAQSLEDGALVTVTDGGFRIRTLPIETD
jgi:hypothetical protein